MRILFSKDITINLLSPKTNIGDAIVVKDGATYKFYIHKFSGFELVEKTESIKIITGAHVITTIFENNDLQTRTGDAEALLFLKGVFKNPYVQSFFQSAYDILKFKEDRWDCDMLYRLYTTVTSLQENTEERNFISYLNVSLKKYFDNLLKNGKSKAEALRLIKNEHKDDFMDAFLKFKKSYPNKSILDE